MALQRGVITSHTGRHHWKENINVRDVIKKQTKKNMTNIQIQYYTLIFDR